VALPEPATELNLRSCRMELRGAKRSGLSSNLHDPARLLPLSSHLTPRSGATTQALRADRLEAAMSGFICRMLNVSSVSPPSMSISGIHQFESSAEQPILFLTTPGADPSQVTRFSTVQSAALTAACTLDAVTLTHAVGVVGLSRTGAARVRRSHGGRRAVPPAGHGAGPGRHGADSTTPVRQERRLAVLPKHPPGGVVAHHAGEGGGCSRARGWCRGGVRVSGRAHTPSWVYRRRAHGPTLEYHQLPHGSSTRSLTHSLTHSQVYVLVPHPEFRLFLTAEPHAKFPPSLLESSLKITFEAPPGTKKNLLRTYEAWPQEFLASGPPVRAQVLFLLAWFHAVVQERRTYVPQGWSKFYEFSFADLRSAADIIDLSIQVPLE
jgi:hypothetical protein